ncbi:unnamed protein product [Soboliphyme baturini]|uniref:Piezo_RRas_bdg domain-containing protein n=1 Tax=Soboliphyme baturini TaxID=241478 RepID=A0A183J8J1_9BILA|nr:unnamed protein product [Soboliphyme baturini]
MKTQQEKEKRLVEKIKKSAEMIRNRYLKSVEGKAVFEPTTYGQAKRAGDYYMFEYDLDADVVDTTQQEEDQFEDVSEGSVEKLGPAQMIHRAAETDMTLAEIAAGHKLPVLTKVSSEDRGSLSSDSPSLSPPTSTKAAKSDIFVGVVKFALSLMGNGLRWLATVFDSYSTDYRFVAYVLNTEKMTLTRDLSNEIAPDSEVRDLHHIVSQSDFGKQIYQPPSEQSIIQTEQSLMEERRKRSSLLQFLVATYYLLIANTETICFVAIIVNQMMNSSVISLPLPLLIFFWGTLCSPRPPKIFWIILIAYIEVMIVVKFFFQFDLFPWSHRIVGSNEPLYPPRIIGIEKKPFFALSDVVLLMILFFHRYHLKVFHACL